DKFSGYDRIETGTRVNAGLQYTWQSSSGPFARFLFGQSYHLAGDNIYRNPGVDPDGRSIYSPTSGLETDRSDYVLGAYWAPTSFLRTLAQARFDESNFDVKRANVYAQVNYGPFLAQATYTYSAADPTLNILSDQQDVLGLLGLRISE